MLGYVGYRAARGQWDAYQKSRKQPGGKWTLTAVLFLVVPFTVLEMLVKAAQESGAFWVWLPVNIILVALTVASSGLLGRLSFARKVMTVYGRPEPDLTSAAAMRARVRELAATAPDGLLAATAPDGLLKLPEPAQAAGDGTRALFLEPCEVCGAQSGVACPMGAQRTLGRIAGIPVVMVRERPAAFCHMARMAAGVRAGTVRREDLEARFSGRLPPALAQLLGE